MSPRLKLWLALWGFLALLVGALSVLYLQKTGESLYEQFHERAIWRAQVFAGLAARHLDSPATLDGLLSTVFIATDVLYAQVVHQGEILITRAQRTGLSLPVEPLSTLLLIQQRRTDDLYWDVIYSLDGNGQAADSYVRLGLALAPLEQELYRERLTVFVIAVALLGGAAVFFWWLTGLTLLKEISRPAPTAQALSAEENAVESEPEEASVAISISSPSPPLKSEELVLGSNISPVALQIDDASKRVFVKGAEIKLSPKEYDLLRLLASEPGRVFTNEEILQAIWAGRKWATAQDVKQYIYFLRKKLEADPEHPRYIVTVRGFGYKLDL